MTIARIVHKGNRLTRIVKVAIAGTDVVVYHEMLADVGDDVLQDTLTTAIFYSDASLAYELMAKAGKSELVFDLSR